MTLVDTSPSQGVERITKDGLVADGVEYKVDCIVFATGFEISTGLRLRWGFKIRGRDGQSIYDHWSKGPRTFHGYAVHNFPNWFFVGGSQNGLSPNFTSMLTERATHIAYIIKQVKERGATMVESTAQAEGEWLNTIYTLGEGINMLLESCTPGHYNNEGKVHGGEGRFLGETYAPGLRTFNTLPLDWRNKGDMPGLELN